MQLLEEAVELGVMTKEIMEEEEVELKEGEEFVSEPEQGTVG